MKKKVILSGLVLLLVGMTVQAGPYFRSFTYQIALPMGNTSDYIGNTSFLGVGVEGRRFLNPHVSAGFSMDYNYFSQNNRRMHATPLLFNIHVYMGQHNVRPFLGFGAGTYYFRRYLDYGWGWGWDYSWHFGISPEVGIAIFSGRGGPYGFIISGRYHYAFGSSGVNDQSYWAIKIGGFMGGF